jgi:hypothetical protein
VGQRHHAARRRMLREKTNPRGRGRRGSNTAEDAQSPWDRESCGDNVWLESVVGGTGPESGSYCDSGRIRGRAARGQEPCLTESENHRRELVRQRRN